MSDLDEFCEIVRLFCDHAIVATRRYWILTDWGDKSGPEYFIKARITDRPGKRIPMNMEIPMGKIWEWYGEGKRKPANLRGTPDFVIYKPDPANPTSKDKKYFHVWGFIELKRHSDVSGDRAKLKTMLRHFPGCFGAAIGIAKRPHDDWLDEEAKKEGPKLVFGCQKRMEGHTFHAFGYIHQAPASARHRRKPVTGATA
jgi:hypothetical protein